MIQMPIESWEYFKDFAITTKALQIQYSEDSDNYYVYGPEIPFIWKTELQKKTHEAIDFENNYKSAANQKMITVPEADTEGKAVQKVYQEIHDNRFTPKFTHQIGSFSGNTCTLTFRVPGTLGAETRFLFDGYLMTDAFYFGDKVSDISVVINDATLAAAMGVSPGYVADTFHDDEITTGEPGWLLWAGEGGIGEVDVENAGGMKNIIGGADIVITVTKDASSSATQAGCNLFWSSKS